MKRTVLGSIFLALVVGSFYLGLYTGNVQGIIYYYGLHSNDVARRIMEIEGAYEYGEVYEGEMSDIYNYRLTSAIQWYGAHVDRLQPFLLIPSPLELVKTGESSMTYAIQYRIDNPHLERAPPISPEEQAEMDKTLLEDVGPLDEETLKRIEDMKKQNEIDYSKAIQHVKAGNDDA